MAFFVWYSATLLAIHFERVDVFMFALPFIAGSLGWKQYTEKKSNP